MPAPVRQSIIFDIQAPKEASGLSGIVAELAKVQTHIETIQRLSSRGLFNLGDSLSLNKSQIEKQIVDIAKSSGIKGKVALEDIFKGMKLDPGISSRLMDEAKRIGDALKNSYKFSTNSMSWTGGQSPKTMAATVNEIFNSAIKSHEQQFKNLLTPQLGKLSGITPTVEGKIKLVIPASQIEAVIEGKVHIAGQSAQPGQSAGTTVPPRAEKKERKKSPASLFGDEMSEIELGLAQALKSAPGIEKVVAAYRSASERIKGLAEGELGEKVGGGRTLNRALIRATKLDQLASSTESETTDASIKEIEKRMAAIRTEAEKSEAAAKKRNAGPGEKPRMGTYSAGSDSGFEATRSGERSATEKEFRKQEAAARHELDTAAEQMARDEKMRQASVQAQVNDGYQRRLQAIKAEEGAITHRYNLEKERMAILEGPDARIAQAGALRQLGQDYGRLSKMSGVHPSDRLAYQAKSEILEARAQSMQTIAERDPSHRGGSRWLNTGLKGWTPEGLAKNILTVTGWTAAVSAMYAPIELARYSLQRMVDIGLQTQRLSQVFKGVGGNAQELTHDVLALAVATGQSTEAAMEAAIGWSRFGLSRRDVVEGTRVSLMAANTANIAPEVATERMSAIYSDYGLNVGQLSGALGMLEHTANTAKVSVKDLMDAVMISGSAARQSGMSFAEFQGIVGATVSRTSQTGNRIATMLKSVLGTIYNPEKQQKLRMDFGVEVLDQNAKLKPSEQIFREMYSAYQKMDSTQKKLFSYTVGDKQQANRFISMMEGYARAQDLAYTAQLNLNTAEEANARIMETQHAALAALRAEWDKFISTTSNAPGGGALLPAIGGGIAGAIRGFARGGGPMGALTSGAQGFGLGAFGGVAAGSSSLNEGMIDLERFGKNLLSLATHPAVSGLLSGAFMGRMAGRSVGNVVMGSTAMKIGAGAAGMSEAEFAAMGSRFGPWGAVIGGGLGLASGLGSPGPRNLTEMEKLARGGDPAETTQAHPWRTRWQWLSHPIRTFNAFSDLMADNPYERFADERGQKVDAYAQHAAAYSRAQRTIKAVSETLGLPGESAKEKLRSITSITSMLGEHAKPATLLAQSGDYAGASKEMEKAAAENATRALEENKKSVQAIQDGIALGQAKIDALQKGITPGGNSKADVEATKQIADLRSQMLADQQHMIELQGQENELDMQSADHISQKHRNLVQLTNAMMEGKRRLSELTPGVTAEDQLDRQNELLHQQSILYHDLETQLRASGNAALADEYLKKMMDANALIDANQNPARRADAITAGNRELALTRYGQASENSAIGFTESEKKIARAKFDEKTGTDSTDNDQRYSADVDYHKTRIDLVTRYNQLLSEQKQLQMDIQREYGKSLLFGDPGDLLTKMSAMRYKQRGSQPGDWFAMSGGVRQEADILAGGEQGRTNRRERQKILEYFGGSIPTIPQEQAEANRRYFPPVQPAPPPQPPAQAYPNYGPTGTPPAAPPPPSPAPAYIPSVIDPKTGLPPGVPVPVKPPALFDYHPDNDVAPGLPPPRQPVRTAAIDPETGLPYYIPTAPKTPKKTPVPDDHDYSVPIPTSPEGWADYDRKQREYRAKKSQDRWEHDHPGQSMPTSQQGWDEYDKGERDKRFDKSAGQWEKEHGEKLPQNQKEWDAYNNRQKEKRFGDSKAKWEAEHPGQTMPTTSAGWDEYNKGEREKRFDKSKDKWEAEHPGQKMPTTKAGWDAFDKASRDQRYQDSVKRAQEGNHPPPDQAKNTPLIPGLPNAPAGFASADHAKNAMELNRFAATVGGITNTELENFRVALADLTTQMKGGGTTTATGNAGLTLPATLGSTYGGHQA